MIKVESRIGRAGLVFLCFVVFVSFSQWVNLLLTHPELPVHYTEKMLGSLTSVKIRSLPIASPSDQFRYGSYTVVFGGCEAFKEIELSAKQRVEMGGITDIPQEGPK